MKLSVATPIHDRPTAHYAVSVTRFLMQASKDFEQVSFSPPLNVSNLAEARCVLLAEALDMGADKLLFIDDDILFTYEDARKIIDAEGDVVSAVYRKKTPKVRHVGYSLENVGMPPESRGPLMGMAAVGMGLTSIDLSFIRRMLEKDDGAILHFKREGLSVPALFEFRVGVDLASEVRFLGEDEVFCRHVRLAGGKVWLHTDVHVGHVGHFVYS